MPNPATAAFRGLPPSRDLHARYAFAAVGFVTLLRLLWLSSAPIDLYPDEAQYWVWAQHPAWGYFSKPPVIAWLIWLTTAAFGDGDLAVKASAPALYIATSMLVFWIGRRLYDGRIGAWSAIAFVTLPSVSLSSLIVSTDVPLLLFWALATYAFIRAREPGGRRWWIVVGLAGGLGLLAKYAMGFWLASALGLVLLRPAERPHWRGCVAALLLALLVYAPNLAWNAAHGFVSYHHTEANADIHGLDFHLWGFLLFAASQALVFGPVFLATLLLIVARAGRDTDPRTQLLLAFSLPTVVVMLATAALSRAQANWAAPTYITATVLVVAFLTLRGRDLLLQWSVVLHVLVAVLTLGADDIAHAAGMRIPGHLDPLHRLHGWRVLGRSLSDVRVKQGLPPLLFNDRELMASMIYYMEPHPFEARIWNPGGGVQNGFEMTSSLPPQPGGDYLWITADQDRRGVESRFASHEEVAHLVVPIGKGLARSVTAEALHGFEGYRSALP